VYTERVFTVRIAIDLEGYLDWDTMTPTHGPEDSLEPPDTEPTVECLTCHAQDDQTGFQFSENGERIEILE
jgi:hypothetical protein